MYVIPVRSTGQSFYLFEQKQTVQQQYIHTSKYIYIGTNMQSIGTKKGSKIIKRGER